MQSRFAMKGLLTVALVFACALARAGVVYVWSGATGTGSGESWANACPTFAEGFAKAAGGGELWIAGDQTVTSLTTVKATGSVIVRGGFSGTSPESTAAARAAGAVSTVTANDACQIMMIEVVGGFQVTFERMVFTHALTRAIEVKNGTGEVAFYDCQFLANDTTAKTANVDHPGRGIYVKGTSSNLAGLVTVSNCIFRANASSIKSGQIVWNSGNGAAIWMQYGKGLVIDDSTFITNGNAFASGFGSGSDPSRDGTSGSAIYVEYSSNVVVRGSSFRGNRASHYQMRGGTVCLEGVTGSAAFTNCLFVGNEDVGVTSTGTGVHSGAIVANLASSETPLSIDTCTFAYNIGDSLYGPGGVSVVKGAATIRNSIFFGNLRAEGGASGADLVVAEYGSADVDYSLFTSSGNESITTAGLLTRGTHLVYGDPLFVTPIEDFQALVITALNAGRYAFDRTSHDAVVAFDVHLQSKVGYWRNDGTSATATVNSPALDAADPAADYSKEPKPNGSCRNLGGYANTARASKSNDPAAPSIGAFTVAFPDGYTRPSFTVSFTASSGEWLGSAEVIYGTETAGNVVYAYTNDIGSVRNGDTVTSLGGTMLEPGATLHARVTVKTATASAAKDLTPVTVTGEIPAWWDVTCPSHAIAVCGEAFGSGDGSRWRDACTTLSEAYAVALRDPAKTEIWIAGDLAITAGPTTFAPTRDLTIRGGFTRLESTAEERAAGAVSTLNANDKCQILTLTVAEGTQITIERIVFAHALVRAVEVVNGTGEVSFYDCQFLANDTKVRTVNENHPGRGLYVMGTSANKLAGLVTLSNCIFRANASSISTATWNSGNGAAIWMQYGQGLVIDDSSFITNGNAFAAGFGGGSDPSRDGTSGSAIYVENSSTVVVRGSTFRGNRATHYQAYGGSVRLEGVTGSAAFTNCLFVGNEDPGATPSGTTVYSGALVANLASSTTPISIEKCTFAYNIGDSLNGPGGFSVVKGAATIRNSIFCGNLRSKNGTSGADLVVAEDGSANVDYTLFTSSGTESVTAAGSLTCGSHLVYGDAQFVTSIEDFEALVGSGVGTGRYAFIPTSHDAVVAFNAHLRGAGYRDEFTGLVTTRYPKAEDSPAIDAGNPSDPLWRLEPRLNGQRLNLGAYGGTPHATKSRGCGFAILGR